MPTTADVTFRWPRSTTGHRWIDARPVNDNWSIGKKATRFLIPTDVRIVAVDFFERPAHLILKRESGLFIEFSRLSCSEDTFQAFADTYGSLSQGALAVPVEVSARFPKPPSSCSLAHARLNPFLPIAQVADQWQTRWNERGAVNGDSFDRWSDNTRFMQFLVQLWMAIKSKNSAKLVQMIDFRIKDNWTYVELRYERPLLDSGYSVSHSVPGCPQNLKEASRYILQIVLGDIVSTGVQATFGHGDNGAWNLALSPQSLLDAMWLQFAVAVANEKSYRDCEVCGKPFEVSIDVHRTNRTLCSSTCKARAHRMRRTKAIELAKNGMKPKQIAKAVGSQLSTVEKWLLTRKDH